MKEIPLVCGNVALVDDDDFDKVSEFKWITYRDGNVTYARISREGLSGCKHLKMHHLVFTHPPARMQIDHIDGNGLNNQKSNLRIVSHRQNQWNQHVNKTSKYPGVCFDKKRGKFISGIKILGKRISLGSFENEFTAFQSYVVAYAVLVCDPE